jgi:hypothetical protein
LDHPSTCPQCGNNSLMAVYAHRLCDACGWHTPGFENVQLGKFNNPISRLVEAQRHDTSAVEDFLSDMQGLPHSIHRRVRENEIRSRAISWCSRWMPEMLAAGAIALKRTKETTPEHQLPPSAPPAVPTKAAKPAPEPEELAREIPTHPTPEMPDYESPLKKCIHAGLTTNRKFDNEALREWMDDNASEDVKKLFKDKKRNPDGLISRAYKNSIQHRKTIEKATNKVRTHMKLPAAH